MSDALWMSGAPHQSPSTEESVCAGCASRSGLGDSRQHFHLLQAVGGQGAGAASSVPERGCKNPAQPQENCWNPLFLGDALEATRARPFILQIGKLRPREVRKSHLVPPG